MRRPLLWLLMGVMPALATAQDEPLRVAYQGELLSLSQTQLIKREPLPASLDAPLGSLWKLFVYAWLVDTGAREPAYECRGQSREEVYCCSAGGKIERDQALVKSCGLYFEPARLGIAATDWRAYWQARQAPSWLLDLPAVQPATRVSVAELLSVLALLPAQEQMRRVLLDVVLNAADGNVAGELGGRLRVKTWSWLGDQDAQSRQGGFAGWSADGAPIWAGGRGTSQMVLRHYGQALASVLPTAWPVDAGRCVEVRLFSKYPVSKVLSGDRVAPYGPLRGDYRVEFANGNALDIHSDGELFLLNDKLVARLDREEYVARVLEREAKPEPAEAAKALAVAIRTYLLQNATRNGDCLSIDDSSNRQRVAPRRPRPSHATSRRGRRTWYWLAAPSPITPTSPARTNSPGSKPSSKRTPANVTTRFCCTPIHAPASPVGTTRSPPAKHCPPRKTGCKSSDAAGVRGLKAKPATTKSALSPYANSPSAGPSSTASVSAFMCAAY